jgi:hypothetical protein
MEQIAHTTSRAGERRRSRQNTRATKAPRLSGRHGRTKTSNRPPGGPGGDVCVGGGSFGGSPLRHQMDWLGFSWTPPLT